MSTKHTSMILIACLDTSIIVPDNTQSKELHVSEAGVVKDSLDTIQLNQNHLICFLSNT